MSGRSGRSKANIFETDASPKSNKKRKRDVQHAIPFYIPTILNCIPLNGSGSNIQLSSTIGEEYEGV